eukprot:CAMPEP_0201695054 /NCGR_PEP_ID=MMETSP0578-20130828/7123_1 /ASSEMBLY_ACC=CAM_ASM_000663 /TAXON_ID=267565 /ORGANISM="Skeletonema grethea, Strain CCMP 1804" /LENGTH=62 /DNA_ID=CAMNT_0048180829 /DNA_START=142 /DNA_END=330 /DNA_ORIENTATION=-
MSVFCFPLEVCATVPKSPSVSYFFLIIWGLVPDASPMALIRIESPTPSSTLSCWGATELDAR